MQEKYQKVYDVPTELVDNVTNINVADGAGASGSLLPPVTKPLHRGGKRISFKLDKWGFKDDVAKVSRVAMQEAMSASLMVTWSRQPLYNTSCAFPDDTSAGTCCQT